MINLSIKIKDIELRSPVILAAGTCSPDIAKFTNIKKLGAIITKSITLYPNEGNPTPRTIETPCGMLNSIGLDNPGVDKFISAHLKNWLLLGIPVIASVAGKTIEEYEKVIKKLNSTDIIGFEINVSCPNVQGIEWFKDANNLKLLTKRVKNCTDKLTIIKLSPNVSDIQKLAIACEESGADAISLINTIYGLKIDIKTKKSVLGGITGGLSGPCIKPVAIYYVYKVSQVCKIPIIGIGGIMNYIDALEFLIVGAIAIEIGTANFINPNTAAEIVDGIENYCKQNKIKNIKKIIGTRKF